MRNIGGAEGDRTPDLMTAGHFPIVSLSSFQLFEPGFVSLLLYWCYFEYRVDRIGSGLLSHYSHTMILQPSGEDNYRYLMSRASSTAAATQTARQAARAVFPSAFISNVPIKGAKGLANELTRFVKSSSTRCPFSNPKASRKTEYSLRRRISSQSLIPSLGVGRFLGRSLIRPEYSSLAHLITSIRRLRKSSE